MLKLIANSGHICQIFHNVDFEVSVGGVGAAFVK